VAAISRRHEARALLVTGQYEPDLGRSRQAIEKVEILLAGHAEYIFDPFFLEALDKNIRGFGHAAAPLAGLNQGSPWPTWTRCNQPPAPGFPVKLYRGLPRLSSGPDWHAFAVARLSSFGT
jgi:hypothetical protein